MTPSKRNDPIPWHYGQNMKIRCIVKISKLCNLRCRYCYETDELADPSRMSLEQIKILFCHIGKYILDWGTADQDHELSFIWHGGEPFAQPLPYWEDLFRLQMETLTIPFPNLLISNSIQSNLTLISEKHLPLLRSLTLGFSYDVINHARLTAGGQSTDSLLRERINWLLSENIPLGGIAVISTHNISYPEQIASFFLAYQIPFRALNIYQGKDVIAGAQTLAVSFERYVEFFKIFGNLPQVRQSLANGLRIDPIWTAEKIAVKWRNQELSDNSFEEACHQDTYLAVNTNGDVYSQGDCYNPEYRYGNIFTQPMIDLLFFSEGRARRIQRTKQRFKAICQRCFLFRKGCDGTFVSHATPEDIREFEKTGSCYYGVLVDWILNNRPVPLPTARHKPNRELRLVETGSS